MADMPALPNYTQLAQQTQASNQQAMNQQTLANRPNQTNQTGSLTWTQDPTTGQWTQTQSLNPTLTGAANSQQQTQAGLSAGANGMVGQAVSSLQNPMDTSGVSGVNAYDPNKYLSSMDSGFNGVQGVTDAMMGRLQPGMDQARAGLIQRLRSQGVSQDSEAYQRALDGQNRSDVDARQQALLAGTAEYDRMFNRNLQQNGQNSNVGMNAFNTSTQDRARQLTELEQARNRPLNDLKGLMGAAGPVQASPFAGFNTSGNAGGVDYYGAGKDKYSDALDYYNAESARAAANRASNISLGTNVAGGLLDAYGDDIGGWLKGLFGG